MERRPDNCLQRPRPGPDGASPLKRGSTDRERTERTCTG